VLGTSPFFNGSRLSLIAVVTVLVSDRPYTEGVSVTLTHTECACDFRSRINLTCWYYLEELLCKRGSGSSCIWLPLLGFVRVRVVADTSNDHTGILVHQPRSFHLKADNILLPAKLFPGTSVPHHLICRTYCTIVYDRFWRHPRLP
jgi:hypothetical protein